MRMVQGGHLHTSLLEPNLPRSLRDVIARAVERNPMNRYPHARAIAFDLRREMLRLGLLDAQTCIRHAVVGWCEVRSSDASQRHPSAIVPSNESGERPSFRAPTSSGDTEPSIPQALRSRR